MSPSRLRSRMLDLAVATVSVACMCAPLLPSVLAADGSSSVVESGGVVDQRVMQGGIISNPLNGRFESGGSGVRDGLVQWDVYTTAADGMKLVVSSDRSPAMRDAKSGVDIADYGDAPASWSVGSSERRFGMTVTGTTTLGRFDDGAKWRGFDGKRPIEVARRAAPAPKTRTTVKLRAEFGSSLPSGARPTANVIATAVPNL